MITTRPPERPRPPITAITCRSRIGFDPRTGPGVILRIPADLTLERAYSLVDRELADIGELKAPLAMPEVPATDTKPELTASATPTEPPLVPTLKKQPRL